MISTLELVLCAVLASAEIDSVSQIVLNEQLDGPLPRTFEDVYGSVKRVRGMPKNWAQRNNSRERGEDYHAVRKAGNCTFPMDIVLIVDSTASTGESRERLMTEEFKKMIDELDRSHPGSKIGMVSFKDKPIPTLGNEIDYCYRVDAPMEPTNLTALQQAYSNLWFNGGMDPAENQFGALVYSFYNSHLNWEPSPPVASKVGIVITDAIPHFDEDGLNAYGLGPFDVDADDETACTGNYYAGPGDIQSAANDVEAYLSFLVYKTGVPQPHNAWNWLNDFLGQPPALIRDVEKDGSDWWEQLSKVIDALETLECEPETTTAAPTTVTTAGTTKTRRPPLCTSSTPKSETGEVICEDPERHVVIRKHKKN